MKVYILDKKSKGLVQMVMWLSQDKRISAVEVFEEYIDLIENIGNSPPSVCIIRLGANEIPGLRAAEMVKQICSEIKIVFVSDDRDYALDAYEIGAYGYLLCPVAKDKFEKCLREVV